MGILRQRDMLLHNRLAGVVPQAEHTYRGTLLDVLSIGEFVFRPAVNQTILSGKSCRYSFSHSTWQSLVPKGALKSASCMKDDGEEEEAKVGMSRVLLFDQAPWQVVYEDRPRE